MLGGAVILVTLVVQKAIVLNKAELILARESNFTGFYRGHEISVQARVPWAQAKLLTAMNYD